MPLSEFALRRAALQRQMAEHKLDAFVVGIRTQCPLSDGIHGQQWHGSWCCPHRAVFLTDPRYRIQAAQEVDCPVRVVSGPMLPHVVALLRRAKSKRVGFEKARMSVEAYLALKDAMPMRSSLEPVAGWIERQRMVKSVPELSAIRRSVELNSRAFEQALRRIRPGMRESELAAELDYRVRRSGADGPAFDTIVAGGARTALPHAHPTNAELRRGQLVLVDMGAMLDGYASDMTRMLFLGRPDARVKHAYGAVLEAQLAAIDASGQASRHMRSTAPRAAFSRGMAWPARLCIPPGMAWDSRFMSRRASARMIKPYLKKA